MAILSGGITFTGKLGNLCAYKVKGSDKIIIRTKGGASKEQIKESPGFQRTRENNTEFAGCAYAAKAIRRQLFPLKHLADYNFTSTLTKLAKNIQLLDKVSDRGKRSIQLSHYGHLLEGFQLNQQNPFDSMLRHPVRCTVERETGSATITVPQLLPGLNLMLPWQYSFFRIIAIIGLVGDITCKKEDYSSIEKNGPPVTATTQWQSVTQPLDAQDLTLQLRDLHQLDDTKTILVGIGIEMGKPYSNKIIHPVKYAGAAKILATG
ncbi:hypothetical protein [Chitinophaga arvensicola]|uniref:Uncharacterized protein n=1 Tax=Chitinophaga arvensicola TaxID=29529 RepID=A0A1I0RTB0_9BACT|nr:hypothetical protein [Chitinophaga arvensicola]SEW44624.1 hypothetical protein SAMN04488122_3356 [Chitinophaga arvensicola]